MLQVQVVKRDPDPEYRKVSSSAGVFLGPGCTATHIRFQDRLSYYATVLLQPDLHRDEVGRDLADRKPRKIRCERGTVCALMADSTNLEEPAGRD